MPIQRAFGVPHDLLGNQEEPAVGVADPAINPTEAYGKN
jgi:hypothetical protein